MAPVSELFQLVRAIDPVNVLFLRLKFTHVVDLFVVYDCERPVVLLFVWRRE